jgi:hypothetical protein
MLLADDVLEPRRPQPVGERRIFRRRGARRRRRHIVLEKVSHGGGLADSVRRRT